jgi:hypothetical protein
MVGGMKISVVSVMLNFVALQVGIGYLMELSSGILEGPRMMAVSLTGLVRYRCSRGTRGHLFDHDDRRRALCPWVAK